MRQLFKDAEHLFRMAGLFVIGTGSFLVLRALLIPADFGELGHYRAGALADNMAAPLVYAGRQACAECHEEVLETRRGGAHQNVGCESCHGPLALHAGDPTREPSALPRVEQLCLNCHMQMPGRPASFPQVVEADHSDGDPCADCHDPHRPDFE